MRTTNKNSGIQDYSNPVQMSFPTPINLEAFLYKSNTLDPIPFIYVSQVALVEKNAGDRHSFDPWVGKVPWSRKWQSTLVCLPGEFQGQRSLAGYSAWGRKGQTQLK